jgi:hypothetical protein
MNVAAFRDIAPFIPYVNRRYVLHPSSGSKPGEQETNVQQIVSLSAAFLP